MLSGMDLFPVQVTLNTVISTSQAMPGCTFYHSKKPLITWKEGTHIIDVNACHMPPNTLQQLSLMAFLEGGVDSPPPPQSLRN